MADKLKKILKDEKIPIITDQSLNIDEKKYVIIGNYNELRIKRIYNKIMNGICVRNKRIFTAINKELRKFYKNKKVPGSQKIKIIQSPDKYFSIRLVNGGFKLTRPYILKNKLLTGNKKGLKDLRERIDKYSSEFSKFKSFLNNGSKVSSGKGGSGVIGCGNALIRKLKKFNAEVTKTYYDDDRDSYPMLEISSEPTSQENKILNTLFNASQLRNNKYNEKIKKLNKSSDSLIINKILVDDLFKSYDKYDYRKWPLGLIAVSIQ
jgi:hypothetical protein